MSWEARDSLGGAADRDRFHSATGPPSAINNVSQVSERNLMRPSVELNEAHSVPSSSPRDPRAVAEALVRTAEFEAIEPLQPGTHIIRQRAVEADLRKNFGLEVGECVLDDFMCALQKRLLYQGRLYVFERTLCFNSRVFGHKKDKVIPLLSVTSVRKRKNLGFPNSIEVQWGDGRREFFTSFVSREEAYKLIIGAWSQAAPENAAAQLFRSQGGKGRNRLADEGVFEQNCVATERHDGDTCSEASTTEASEAHMSNSQGRSDSRTMRLLARGMQKVMRPVTKRYGAERRSDDGDSGVSANISRQTSGDGSLHGPQSGLRTGCAGLLDDTGAANTGHRSSWQGSNSADYEPRLGRSSDSDDDEGSSGSNTHVDIMIHDFWKPSSQPPPPVPENMQNTFTGQLRGVDTFEMCELLFSDQSSFFVDVYEGRGNKHVKKTPWKQLPHLGRIREMEFLTPIESRFGPPEAMCFQKQRYAMYGGHRFVFETDQTIPDIPYGDCFQVESRWNFDLSTEAGEPVLNVETFVVVEFCKSTIMRKIIEKTTVDKCRKAHSDFLDAAQTAINEREHSGQQRGSPASCGDTGALAPTTREISFGWKCSAPGRMGSPAREVPPRTCSRTSAPRLLPQEQRSPSASYTVGSPTHVDALLRQIPREHWPAISRRILQDSASADGHRGAASAPGGKQRLGAFAPWQWLMFAACIPVAILHLWVLWRLSVTAPSSGPTLSAVSALLPSFLGASRPQLSEGSLPNASPLPSCVLAGHSDRQTGTGPPISDSTAMSSLQHQLSLMASQIADLQSQGAQSSEDDSGDPNAIL